MKHRHSPHITEVKDYGMALAHGPEPEDLIESLEERLGIVLPHGELETIRTPGQLIDLIMTKVEPVPSSDCLSQRAFHLIREAAMKDFDLPRRAIATNTRLGDLIPSRLRRTRWKGFCTSIGAGKWPELRRSKPVFTILALLTAAGFVVACIMIPTTGMLNFLSASAVTVAFAFMLAFLTRPLKREFPLYCFTVGDLVGWIVAENPQLVEFQAGRWTRERVSAAVRKLIVEWAGVRDFTEDSLFYPTRMII